MNAEQQNKALALLMAIAYDGSTYPVISKAIKKVLAEMPAEEVAKAAGTKINFGGTHE